MATVSTSSTTKDKRFLVDKSFWTKLFRRAFTKHHGDTINYPNEFHQYATEKKFLSKVDVKKGFRSHLEPSFKVPKICYYSLADDFLKFTPRKTIEELKDCKEDGDYAVYATIKGVDGGPDWFFATCRCGTEVVPKFGSYYCKKCEKRVVNVIPRYRIKAKVIDPSDSATFVILEKLGCLLLHKSCTEILKSTENDGGDLTQPSEFQHMLIDTSFIFKVEVKKSCFNELEPSYDVVDICFNDSIITKFKDLNPAFFDAQTDLTAGSEKSLSLDLQDVQSSSCVKDLMSQFSDVDGSQLCQSESGTPFLTPAKGVSHEMQATPEVEMSTHNMKCVKIEKE